MRVGEENKRLVNSGGSRTMVPESRLAHDRPPVILLGGEAIALSVARTLGRCGVKVYALDKPCSYIRQSRFSNWIPLGYSGDPQEAWLDWLTGAGIRALRGA
jgi:D-aspartate ligase